MNEKKSKEFKISLDDASAEHEDLENLPSKKTSAKEKSTGGQPVQSPPWLIYILIVVVIAAMVAGYFNIRNDLVSVDSSGSQKTQVLSEDLESKFSELSGKFSSLEASLNTLAEAQTGLTESVAALKDDVSKAEKSISSLTSSKVDKKSLNKSLSEVKEQMGSLKKSVDKNIAETAVMSAKLIAALNEMDSLFTKASEDQNALKALMDGIQTDKASKKELLTEIDHVENVLKTNQDQIDQRISSTLETLQRLEMRTSALEAKAGLSGKTKATADEAEADRQAVENKQEPQTPALPEPGELIERDISH